MQPKKFTKKPVEIEAMRFGPGGIEQLEALKWIDANGGKIYLYDCSVQKADEPFPDGSFWQWVWGSVETIEGSMKALAGDWIIRGVAGEFYPCKSDIFEATYERVADDERTDSVSEVRGDEAP